MSYLRKRSVWQGWCLIHHLMHPSETHCHHYFDASYHFCTLFDAWGLKCALWGVSFLYVCGECMHMHVSWFYANVVNRATFWCTEIHRTPIYTEKLHSFEIKRTRDLSAREGCNCHKKEIRAGLCSHTSSCRKKNCKISVNQLLLDDKQRRVFP